jgi:hypothetical protein
MPASPGLSADERRRRLAARHRLAASHRATTVEDAVRAVAFLHATDSSSVYLAAWARMRTPSLEAVDEALYLRRSLLRMLAMRRTVFVVPVEDAPIVQAAASTPVARVERRHTQALVAQLGVGDADAWLRHAEEAALAELERSGEATAQELAREVPMLAQRARLFPGRRVEGDVSMASRVLLTLGVEGRVVRGRPRGSWLSSQYRWTTTVRWLGHALDAIPVPVARRELVCRYLARFGPATEADIRWWTGWPARDARAALAAAGALRVSVADAGEAYVLSDDLDATPEPDPWVALLPALDPTTMGWKGRDWYLGQHRAALFDTAGNAGPTVWLNGRIVGGWAVLPSGEVVTRLLDDIGREAAAAVSAEASRLTALLKSTGSVPRFTTPLARELVSGAPDRA